MKLDYEKEIRLIKDELSRQKVAVLATSFNDKVTIRSMCIVNDGLTILFETDSRMEKVKHIERNGNVALCTGAMNIEGIATIAGKANEHETFVALYKEKHPGSYKMYADSENEVVVSVEIQRIKMWIYIDKKPYEKVIDIAKKQVELIEYRF